MKNFNNLVNRNLEAVKKRGQITRETTDFQFISKMSEELIEIQQAHDSGSKEDVKNETVDLASVCISFLTHRGYNFVEEFRVNATEKNERRALEQDQ